MPNQRDHGMPCMGEICGFMNDLDAINYLVDERLIASKKGNICGIINNYPGTSKPMPACKGTMSGPLLHLQSVYWRCGNNNCRFRVPVLKDTLFAGMKVPLHVLLQTTYLSMLQIPQKVISTMTRLDHKTVRKVQDVVLTVKAIDRMGWDKEKLMMGGFVEINNVAITQKKRTCTRWRRIHRCFRGTCEQQTKEAVVGEQIFSMVLEKTTTSRAGGGY